MKKVLLLLLLTPVCAHSVNWAGALVAIKKLGLDFLASEMFTESGDHWGPLPKTPPHHSKEEKRDLAASAAEKRRDQETRTVQKKLEAYLAAETIRQKEHSDYAAAQAFSEMTGEALPKINHFELQVLSETQN